MRYFRLRKNSIQIYQYLYYLNLKYSCILNVSSMFAYNLYGICSNLHKVHIDLVHLNSKLFNSLFDYTITGNSYLIASSKYTNITKFFQILYSTFSLYEFTYYINYIFFDKKQKIVSDSLSYYSAAIDFNYSILLIIALDVLDFIVWLEYCNNKNANN